MVLLLWCYGGVDMVLWRLLWFYEGVSGMEMLLWCYGDVAMVLWRH